VARLLREGMLEPLERKTAAILAYLALEGPTPRSKIAGLLWPEVDEERARGNLRQRLHRLKNALGAELVVSDEPLRLLPELKVDVVELEARAFTGDYGPLLNLEGSLLAGHDYDDCPELAEWVETTRERITSLRYEAMLHQVEQGEADGNYADALLWAERLLAEDSISEEAYRRVMRLKYLLGDRAGALKAFQRCQEVLARELGVEPLPQTLELAHTIDRGSDLPQASAAKRPQIPLTVLRPPVLVGREREWALMEEAWEKGQGIAIQGEPGVGKSRLMLDFVASKGPYELLEGRPGDEGIPYAAFARNYRRVLEQHNLPLETWVRQELSRLVPGLTSEAVPPILSEDGKLRFFEAMAGVLQCLLELGLQSVVADDLQFLDTASFEAAQYIAAKLASQGLRFISSYRIGELSAPLEASLRRAIEAGQVLLVELPSLSAQGVADLLEALEVPGLLELSQRLGRYTGGNPMFVLETVKNLLETGQLAHWPEHLPPPGKIGPLIARRLERLSPAALRLARVAAVAGVDFGPQLAAKVLEANPLDLAEPWAELEAALVLGGNVFAHDLIYEATLQGVPVPIKTFLHGRIAEHLQATQADPARIAQHWLEAGESRAAPFLLEAAKAAQAAYRFTEAAEFYHSCAQILAQRGLRDQAFEAYEAEAAQRVRFEAGAALEFALSRLEELAHTPVQKARACLARASAFTELGQGEKAESVAREGYAQAKLAQDEALGARLLGALGNALWLQGRLDQVAILLQELMDLYQTLGDEISLAVCWSRMGTVLEAQSHLHQAISYNRRAEAVFERVGDQILLTRSLNNLAVVQNAVGLKRDARQTLDRALSLLTQMQGMSNLETSIRMLLGDALRDLGEYAEALEQFQRALELALSFNYWRIPYLYKALALTYLVLGQPELTQHQLDQVVNPAQLPDHYRCGVMVVQGELLRAQEKAPTAIYAQAEGLSPGPSVQIELWISQAVALTPQEGLALAEKALEVAQAHELQGLEIAAQTRCAQLLLALNRSAALEHSQAAMQLIANFDPVNFYRGEVLWTHYRALEANARPEAGGFLQATLEWLKETTAKVPVEYRQSFLGRNQVNRAILGAAQQAGLAK